MEFWEEEYEFVSRLSRENSTRFGETLLLQHKISLEKVVLKSVEINKVIGFQQLQNEASFNFNFVGLPKILSTHLSSEKFSILKKFDDGITLTEYWKTVKRKHRLAELKKIALALAPLFQEIQNQQIIHCDVKPENILVSDSSGKMSCSLIDFGLAFRKNELPERKTLFQLAYAPPEIILNRLECADFHSDVFSFCLVIYKLWTGKLPFSQSNPALMTQLQITYPIEKPWRMPKKLWRILEKGLQKHQFKTPPNRLAKDQIIKVLQENNAKRFRSFEELGLRIDGI